VSFTKNDLSSGLRLCFVDEKTIFPAEIGGLVLALIQLFQEVWRWDWADRVYLLHG
jgi:hypothetical protein